MAYMRHEALQTARRTLVLLDAVTARHHANKITMLRRAGCQVLEIEYRDLHKQVGQVREMVEQNGIEFLLFSRNDQVFARISIGPIVRALKIGYSSFSGIDDGDVTAQTGMCLDDLCFPGRDLNLRTQPTPMEVGPKAARSVSLIFDLEQLGGARFGLPRVLELLGKYGARATFFATNFVQAIYRDVIEILVKCGHEVGLHGEYHEYLTGRPLDSQIQMIGRMKAHFAPHASVSGANFIGRMDETTPAALVANEIKYFVHFLEHRYTPFHYQSLPLRPLPYWSPGGTVWMVPLSVETNNRPWFTVKNTIDSAIEGGERSGFRHLNVLMHPFLDGALRHLKGLEKTIQYAIREMGCRPVTVAETVTSLARPQPSAFIYFPFQAQNAKASDDGYGKTRWGNQQRYCARVYSVFQALEHAGFQPALCGMLPSDCPLLWVHPHSPNLPRTEVMRADPLQFSAEELVRKYFLNLDQGTDRVRGFAPSGFMTELTNALRYGKPRSRRDCAGVFPEVALRLAYRVSAGRHVF